MSTRRTTTTALAVGAIVVAAVLVTRARARVRAPPGPVARFVPLRVESGVYLATLSFGGAPAVECVVDTGSAHLLLAGRSCRACDDPTSLRVTGAATTTLAYGTQESRVAWRTGALRIGDVRVRSARAALTRAMRGTTRFNVLGLAPGALQRALGGDGFALAMRDGSGLLALGAASVRALRRRHYAAPATRVPLLPFGDAKFPSYAVRGALRAGASAVWSGDVVVDTGSNFLSCPPRVLDALRPSLRADAPIALAVRTAAGGTLTLTFGPDVYRYADGTLLVDDDEVDAVVLGSLFMRDLVLEFDLDRKELGIAPFRP